MSRPGDSNMYINLVNDQLGERHCGIIQLTRELVKDRLDDIMRFVNSIRNEYAARYGWSPENSEYFLKDLKDKWVFSYAIIDEFGAFCLINFSSIYDNLIHNHCTYTTKNKRNIGLAKIHMLNLSQAGLEHGYQKIEGYFPKDNNVSIALHLKMGWEIDSLRNDREIRMTADLETVRDTTYKLLVKQGTIIEKLKMGKQ